MKKIFLTIGVLFCLTANYAQSKKEKIAQLTFSCDSLNTLVANERNSFNVKSNELNSTLQLQKSEIVLLKKQLETKQAELTAKQEELEKQSAETAHLSLLLIKKQEEIEQLKAVPSSDYLITDNSIGYFKIGGSWQSVAKNDYDYKSTQGYGTCRDACCNGGFHLGKVISNSSYGKQIENPEITIGASLFSESESKTEYKSNPNVFYISTDNCSAWYWRDKISYLIAYSESFKTKEGIGIGTTLEKVQELFDEVVINIGWLEEDINAIQIELASYPSVEFILDVDDAIGGYEKLSSLGKETATISDFKKNTKIKRLIIR